MCHRKLRRGNCNGRVLDWKIEQHTRLKLKHAVASANRGMDRVRGVRDDSLVLADDPSPGGFLADAGGLALPCVGAGLDGNGGWAWCADGALAGQATL